MTTYLRLFSFALSLVAPAFSTSHPFSDCAKTLAVFSREIDELALLVIDQIRARQVPEAAILADTIKEEIEMRRTRLLSAGLSPEQIEHGLETIIQEKTHGEPIPRISEKELRPLDPLTE